MQFKNLVMISVLLAAYPDFAVAQQGVPPLQPPHPTAPPPLRWPLAVYSSGLGDEAARQTEDAVAALTVRGFSQVAPPDALASLGEAALDCLRRDRQDYACVQQAVTGVRWQHHDPLPLVFVDGRLEGGSLFWTCVGRAGIVTVDFVPGDFFTPDLTGRQTSRNRAMACIERAMGFERTREHPAL